MLRFTVCYIILAMSCSFGQLTRGYISGTVQDATGAVVPDVQVNIKNRDTNATLGIETNNSGIYRFVAVEPGTYSVEFTKAGFEVRRVENERLDGVFGDQGLGHCDMLDNASRDDAGNLACGAPYVESEVVEALREGGQQPVARS